MEGLVDIFKEKRDKSKKDNEKLVDELYRQIGQLKVENEWLKKNLHCLSVEEKKKLIESDQDKLSVRKQCESFLKLNRSNLYYEPVRVSEEGFYV